MPEKIILVNKEDEEIGTEEKLKAHKDAKLHRAFSIFIFSGRKMLLQKRADRKYHCGGLWSNTCCSHPRSGETVEDAAHRRLKEEMGFDCKLRAKEPFIYKAEFDNGLTEHELDHIVIGDYNGEEIEPDPREVGDWKWIELEEVKKDVKENPGKYTPWFRIALDKFF